MFNNPDDFKVIDDVLWVNNRDMTSFYYVRLRSLFISDISALALCPNLTRVEVQLNPDADLSPLRELPNLRQLKLYADTLDFEPLRGHPTIEDFHTTAMSECMRRSSIIATFPKLRYLHVSRMIPRSNELFQMQPFVNHPSLESLTLTGVDVPDPENILKIPKLSFFKYDRRTEEGEKLDKWINDELKKRKASRA